MRGLPSPRLSDGDDEDEGQAGRRSWALGRSWLQPDRSHEFARAARLDHQSLVDDLGSDEGAAEAEGVALELRRSGVVISERGLEQMERLFDLIDQLLAGGDVSLGAAAKLLDTLFKITGIAEVRTAIAQKNAAAARSSFSININFSDTNPINPKSKGVTLDAGEFPARNNQHPDGEHE